MKFWLVLLFACLFAGCSDEETGPQQSMKQVHFSLAADGSYNFDMYIHSLTVLAFEIDEAGNEFFYKTLARLNYQDIQNMEEGTVEGKNVTDAKRLNVSLLPGRYRFFFIANVEVDTGRGLIPGVTIPQELFLPYPEGGFDRSVFLANTEVSAGNNSGEADVILKRVVGRLFMKLYGVPSQIETIALEIGGVAARVGIDGVLSQEAMTVRYSHLVKGDNPVATDTVLLDVQTYPTVGEESDITLVFTSRSGEVRRRTIQQVISANRYLQILGTVDDSFGGLLSFDIKFAFFLGLGWRDTKLPDFSLTEIR